MDSNSVIIPVELKTQGLDTSLNDLKSKLSDLTKKLGDVNIGSEAFKNLKKEIDETNKTIKQTGVEIDVNGNILSKLKGNISTLIPGISSLGDAFGALQVTLLELAANPVMATLAAISAIAVVLYKAFSETKDGAKELSVVFEGFHEIGLQVQELLGKVASVIAAVLIPIVKVIVNVVSTFVESLNSLIPAFEKSSDQSEGFSKVMDELGTILQPVGELLTEIIKFIGVMLVDAIKVVTFPMRTMINFFIDLYNKSTLFRDIINGIVGVFRGFITSAAKVIDVLGGIGTAIAGILTFDPKMIKEGMDQALKAGKQVAESFVAGYKGVKAPESKAGEAMKDKEKLNKLTIEGKNLAVEESEVQSKIAKLRVDAQKGIKGAAEEADKAEAAYHDKVIKNKEEIVAYYAKAASINREDKDAVQKLRDAQIDLNNTKTQGYQNELKISRAESKLNKTKKENTAKERSELEKQMKQSLEMIMNADDERINAAKQNSIDYYKFEEKKADDELKFYTDNKKKFMITDADYNKKRIELEKKIKDSRDKYNAIEMEQVRKFQKNKDEIALLEAKNDKQRYEARKKQLLDNYNAEIQNDQLTFEDREVLRLKFEKDIQSIDDERLKKEEDKRQKELSDKIKDQEDEKKDIEKSLSNSEEKFKKLADIENNEYALKQQKLQDAYSYELTMAQKLGQDTTDIIRKYNDDKESAQSDHADAMALLNKKEIDAEWDKVSAFESAGNAIIGAIGQQTELGKGIAVAEAIINTYKSASQVFAAPVPGIAPVSLAVKIATMVSALASGFKNVKSILSTKVPGKSGAATAPTTSFAAPQLFGIGGQQVQNYQQTGQTQKVIVTQTDITRQQNNASQIQRTSVHGS